MCFLRCRIKTATNVPADKIRRPAHTPTGLSSPVPGAFAAALESAAEPSVFSEGTAGCPDGSFGATGLSISGFPDGV